MCIMLYPGIVCSTYGAFTLESILAAAFGRVINVQRGEADEVVKAAKGIFDSGKNGAVRFCMFLLSKLLLIASLTMSIHMELQYFTSPPVTVMFPFLERFMHYFLDKYTNVVEPWRVLYHTALKLIEARKTGMAKAAKVSSTLTSNTDFFFTVSNHGHCIN